MPQQSRRQHLRCVLLAPRQTKNVMDVLWPAFAALALGEPPLQSECLYQTGPARIALQQDVDRARASVNPTVPTVQHTDLTEVPVSWTDTRRTVTGLEQALQSISLAAAVVLDCPQVVWTGTGNLHSPP